MSEYTSNTLDKYNIIGEDGEREITLAKICKIMGIPVPDKFRSIENKIENNVTMKLRHVTEGCYFFIITEADADEYSLKYWINRAVEKGAAVVFVDQDRFLNEGKDINDSHVILVENIEEKSGNFFSYMRKLYGLKVIGVTGTCGKTTTMRFLKKTIGEHYNAYIHSGNLNSYASVANHIMNRLSDNDDVYIQETGASSPGAVKKCAAMLNADIYIILNVFNHHINYYKTYENLFEDKISPDDYLTENGVIITNYDDEGLANHIFKHKVISFGINTKRDVDYRAINIKQNNQYLEFDILYYDEDYKSQTQHIKISILGGHNAYNALATFACCKLMGMTDIDIAKGLRKYSSSGIRQNYKQIGGYKLLIDCYNLCEDSLKADIEAIRNFKIDDSQKKIAVITGENKLGDNSEQITYNVGKTLNTDGIDHIICVGVEEETPYNLNYYCHGRALYAGIKSQGFKNVVYVNTPQALEKEISGIISIGDLILFKGVLYLDLAPVMDKIFGTAFSFDYPYYIARGTLHENEHYIGRKIETIEAIDIIEVKDKNIKTAIIPDYLDGFPVHRISPRLFKECSELESIEFGNTIANIGREAFCGCKNLQEVVIPPNVKMVSKAAFMDCSNLKKLTISEGVQHIGPEAFKGCTDLKDIIIPNSVSIIYPSSLPSDKHNSTEITDAKKTINVKKLKRYLKKYFVPIVKKTK